MKLWFPRIYFLIGLFSIRRFRIVQSNETCQRNHERSCMCSFWVDWLKRENQNLFFLPFSYSRKHTKQTLVEVFSWPECNLCFRFILPLVGCLLPISMSNAELKNTVFEVFECVLACRSSDLQGNRCVINWFPEANKCYLITKNKSYIPYYPY